MCAFKMCTEGICLICSYFLIVTAYSSGSDKVYLELFRVYQEHKGKTEDKAKRENNA